MTSLHAGTETAERIEAPPEGPLTPREAVAWFRDALEAGAPWYPTLLQVIARWTAPEEEIDSVRCRYLIGGEAFDWLRLAQRLVDAAEDLVPPDEAEQLLVRGISPLGESDEEFEAAIGAAKYRAHLNFQYGVIVEELLLLAVELEIVKAGRLIGAGMPSPDVQAYEVVYGKPIEELKVLYAADTGEFVSDRVEQSDLQAFIYWLSKYRMRMAEPARVASDTKKAMAMMSRMESHRQRLIRLAAAKRREGRTIVDVR